MLFPKYKDVSPSNIQVNPADSAPSTELTAPKIVIVGSGMAGLVSGMFLARRGFNVRIFEKREGISHSSHSAGRSMNLTLCERGLKVLDELGIREQILSKTVRLSGRAIHLPNGTTKVHDYGTRKTEVLHAIRRCDLYLALLEASESYPNIRICYGRVLTAINREQKVASFFDDATSEEVREKYDLLVGADGVFSRVRSEMTAYGVSQSRERYSDWCYKEFTLKTETAPLALSANRLHVWARHNRLLVAIPNTDGTLTCNLFLPSAESREINDALSACALVHYNFSDLAPLAKDIARQLAANPISRMVSIETDSWRFDNSIVLVGDAAHGVLPFLGQGVNSAFEDCSALNRFMTLEPSRWALSLREYESVRRPNASALSRLVDEHLTTLQAHVGSRAFEWQDVFARIIERLTLNRVRPIYSLIAHTDTPYATILNRLNFRSRLSRAARPILLAAPFLIYMGLRFWGHL